MSIELCPAPERGEKLLCAVSGGADSMCLLHLLVSGGWDVTAAHFEHGVRGAESLRDAAFVEDWCRDNGVPCVVGHGDAPGYAEEHGLSLEEAARELRYDFLLAKARELGADRVLTAHTMDDSAETLLFNLTRGSGAAGLRGIPRARGSILRPLLRVSRAEIEAYLEKNAVPHVEDSTNRGDDYTRNLLRHQVVPLLREINPRFSEAAARTAELVGRDEDFLDGMAGEFLKRELAEDSLPLDALCALHPAVASRVVRRLFPGLSMERAEAALDFAKCSEYGLLQLPGRTLRREQGRLYLDEDRDVRIRERRLIPGGGLKLPELGLRLDTELCIYRGEIHDLFKTSFLKYEIVTNGILCTDRRPGDRIRPHGRGLSKRLSDLFRENGFTRAERAACLILRDEQGPVLARGLAVDERAWPEIGEKAWKITFSDM